jgi:hypothetical protein
MGTFSMRLAEKAAIVLKRAEELARKNGVTFQHNGRSGSFSHLGVKGTFTISKNVVEIKYTKPVLIPDSMVESQIKQILR